MSSEAKPGSHLTLRPSVASAYTLRATYMQPTLELEPTAAQQTRRAC